MVEETDKCREGGVVDGGEVEGEGVDAGEGEGKRGLEVVGMGTCMAS